MKKKSITLCLLILFLLIPSFSKTNKDIRIISLAPNITEILFSLGLGENLVGRTSFCDFPKETEGIEIVGDFMSFDIEKMILLEPDVVMLTGNEQDKFKNKLKALGIDYEQFYPKSIDELLVGITNFGKRFNKEKEADSLKIVFENTFENLIIPDKKLSCYVELSKKPLVTVGGTSFLNDVLDKAGLINVFKDIDQDYPIVNSEKILLKNPDVIILLGEVGVEDIYMRSAWENISAIKGKRIYDKFNQDLLLRPGPRIIEGIKILNNKVYGNE